MPPITELIGYQARKTEMQVARDFPCPCGSGRTYKKCCGDLPKGSDSSARQPYPYGQLSPASPYTVIRIAGDALIKVPNSLNLITPYILREQEKWFEDEVGFLGKFFRAGMHVIDVGANCGVYTLMMAKAVGDHGHVWAFEPAVSTVKCLEESVSLNHLENVTVIHAALSNRIGRANLSLERSSELNRLVPEANVHTEEVRLTTLDCCRLDLGLKDIEFIKLDAEGEELNILLGAGELLSAESPLIMFELKNGDQVNVGLISRFAELGYLTYRLIPGLNLLVPFDSGESPDPGLLNLFCCKVDRAVALEKSGWLVRHSHESLASAREDYSDWEKTFYSLPFAMRMRQHWQAPGNRSSKPVDRVYLNAIESYFLAHVESCASRERFHALLASFKALKQITDDNQKLTYLSTFARVAVEMRFRGIAIQAIVKLGTLFRREQHAPLDEPFLPVCSRFDHLDPADRSNDWFLASLLEAYETLNAYSSYYTRQPTLRNLEIIKGLRFQSPEMERRRQLIRMRFGMQSGPEPSPLLSGKTEFNLNPEFWNPAGSMR